MNPSTNTWKTCWSDDRMNGCAFQERKGKVENGNFSG